MSISKLERVLYRLRASKPGEDKFSNRALELAIMKEIGTSKCTYKRNRASLIKLQYIKTYNKSHIKLTNKDLTDS